MSEVDAQYFRLRELIHQLPDFEARNEMGDLPMETHMWLGRLAALLHEQGPIGAVEAGGLKAAFAQLQSLNAMQRASAAELIRNTAYNAFARAEAGSAAAPKGAFIPVGQPLDAFRALSHVLREATSDVLIVDPYLSEQVVTDVAPLVSSGVPIRLLSDESTVKPGLAPAVIAWTTQHGSGWSLEARLAPARTLHDRVILVDRSKTWVLTQSFKDIAQRSPASLTAVDAETAGLKVDAYEAVWTAARPLA